MLPTAIASVKKLTQMDKAEDNCRASSKTNGFGPISTIPIFSLHLPIKTFHSSSLLLGFKPFPPPPPSPAAEMAAKSLIRTGAALMNRMMLNPILNHPPNPPPTSGSLRIIPQLFPSLFSNPGSSLHFPNNDAVPDPFSRVSGHGFLHPCGLPSLPFFCPEGDLSDEPMLLFPKRTFQPSTIRRKRNHGFFARKATKGGRRVINRRIAKGRSRVTA